jgi:hypothetical protein
MADLLNTIKTNGAGYVSFQNRNWSYKGDKGTFAKVLRNKDGEITSITVKVAAKGTISSEYAAELSEFCDQIDLDFASISCGKSKTAFF